MEDTRAGVLIPATPEQLLKLDERLDQALADGYRAVCRLLIHDEHHPWTDKPGRTDRAHALDLIYGLQAVEDARDILNGVRSAVRRPTVVAS